MDGVIAGIAVLWLRLARYRWSWVYRQLFERSARGAPLPSVASLDDIAARLAEVTWRPDGVVHLWDGISYPGAVWRSKRDDCDGFAVLAAALLRQWDPGTDPVLLSVVLRPLRRSHTVCVFRQGEALRVFDNERLRADMYTTYRDVATAIAKRGRKMVCWDVASPDPLRVREVHRVH